MRATTPDGSPVAPARLASPTWTTDRPSGAAMASSVWLPASTALTRSAALASRRRAVSSSRQTASTFGLASARVSCRAGSMAATSNHTVPPSRVAIVSLSTPMSDAKAAFSRSGPSTRPSTGFPSRPLPAMSTASTVRAARPTAVAASLSDLPDARASSMRSRSTFAAAVAREGREFGTEHRRDGVEGLDGRGRHGIDMGHDAAERPLHGVAGAVGRKAEGGIRHGAVEDGVLRHRPEVDHLVAQGVGLDGVGEALAVTHALDEGCRGPPRSGRPPG